MHSGLAQYRSTQVSSSSPESILVMLYDGALKFTRIAIDRLSNGNIAEKGLYKAQAIVAELMSTLDHDADRALAARLQQLYIYLINEYVTANTNNSAQHLENALGILTTLRDTWVEAAGMVKKERESGGAWQQARLG
jgi:flagellar secretion chaperone FliS